MEQTLQAVISKYVNAHANAQQQVFVLEAQLEQAQARIQELEDAATPAE